MPENAADTASGQTLFVQVTANFANIFRFGSPGTKLCGAVVGAKFLQMSCDFVLIKLYLLQAGRFCAKSKT